MMIIILTPLICRLVCLQNYTKVVDESLYHFQSQYAANDNSHLGL